MYSFWNFVNVCFSFFFFHYFVSKILENHRCVLLILILVFCRSDLRARFDAVNNASNRALLPSGQESTATNETARNGHIDGLRNYSNEITTIDGADPS